MITFSKLGRYGRFGNQLFQIASTIGIASRNVRGYEFPDWEYSRYFKHPLPQTLLSELHSTKMRTHYEKSTGYYDVDLDKKYNWDLEGYFQSWKYFENVDETIRYYFDLNMSKEEKNAISIHVRRGDYLNLQYIHPVLEMDYYEKAIEYFGKKETYFIFSDDPIWCKNNFKSGNFIFDMGTPEILAFHEMSLCKHHIIANSSFSWWAAFLDSKIDKTIIAPSVYIVGEETLDDRIPKGWIIL